MRAWVWYKEKKQENLAKGQIFILHFSKIRAFGALQPLMVCGFERFTEDQGILVAKTSPAKVVQFEYYIKVELSTLIT